MRGSDRIQTTHLRGPRLRQQHEGHQRTLRPAKLGEAAKVPRQPRQRVPARQQPAPDHEAQRSTTDTARAQLLAANSSALGGSATPRDKPMREAGAQRREEAEGSAEGQGQQIGCSHGSSASSSSQWLEVRPMAQEECLSSPKHPSRVTPSGGVSDPGYPACRGSVDTPDPP